jgi:cellulose synthase/poly-beta-1,6-N-acetylglucosamine synthase-like glycosyltransferase
MTHSVLMIALTAAIGLTAAVLLLPIASDLVSLTRRARPLERKPDASAGLPRFAFLVPAHNEELLIGGCLQSLLALRYARARREIVVIADNCTDNTAAIARAHEVRCLERQDPTRAGKPYAIAWAIGMLDLSEYDAVVVVDADSLIDPDFATALAALAPIREKAIQCYNDVSNRSESALTRMAAVFSAMRCRYINEFKSRAGLNCPLGNGLCIGAAVLQRLGWNAFSISEDTELYAILTLNGVRIESAAAARIYSQEARSLRQSGSQRRRWTAGNLGVLFRHVRPLLGSADIGFEQKLDSLAELTAPAPAVHLGLVLIAVTLTMVTGAPGAPILVSALLASLARPIIFASIALRSDPDPKAAARAFAFFPLYMLWRLGVQVMALAAIGTQTWVRTERHH